MAVSLLFLTLPCGALSQTSGTSEKQFNKSESKESSSRPVAKNVPPPAPAGSSPIKGFSSPDAEKLGYRIGVEDELQISVWREPELSQLVVVRPDGMITLPLVNDIKVAGLKTEELRSQLTERLSAYVNEPQVTIIVRAIRSRKVFVVGKVVRQGAFPVIGKKTVLELISEAGGLAPFAKSSAIYILRDQNGRQVSLRFDYKKVIAGKSADIELLPGDMIVVP